MPMERIEDRQTAFMRTQSVEMRKFWETYPPKVLKRPGAALTLHARRIGPDRALKFNDARNSFYIGAL